MSRAAESEAEGEAVAGLTFLRRLPNVWTEEYAGADLINLYIQTTSLLVVVQGST